MRTAAAASRGRRGKSRSAPPTTRGRGIFNSEPPQQLSKRLGKGDVMKTFRAQNQEMLQTSRVAAQQSYTGMPPNDPSIIKVSQASLVMPGKDLLPVGIDEPGVFDHICRDHGVWINRPDDEILEVYARHVKSLHTALKAINWALHSMSNSDRSTSLFMVQDPVLVSKEAKVHVELSSRPYAVEIAKPLLASLASPIAAATTHVEQIFPSIVPAIDVLRTLKTDVSMRINFGRLLVTQKKKSLGVDMAFSDFAKMVPLYANRGGASLETFMSDYETAEKVMKLFMDPNKGLAKPDETKLRYTVTLKMKDQDIVAQGEQSSAKQIRLLAMNAYKAERWPRINCVVASPDMKLDWGLRADARQKLTKVPDDLRSYISQIVIVPPVSEQDQKMFLQPPRVVLRSARPDVGETQLKTSIIVPFKSTSYAVEVSLVQSWRGKETGAAAAEMFWTMELFGAQWDEAMNRASLGNQEKNWGKGLVDVWPDGGESLEERFTLFVKCVIELQELLEDIDGLGAGMPRLKE